MGHYSYDEAVEIVRLHMELSAFVGDVFEDGTLERVASAVSEAPTSEEAAAAANSLLSKNLIDGPGLRRRLGGVN